MNNTKIEWCDSTWNPVTGCYHNCEYCYARQIARRFTPDGLYSGEAEKDILSQVPIHKVEKPLTRTTNCGKTTKAPYPYGFEPTLHEYHLDDPQKWKKPRNIFVCSMADLFGEWVPDEWIKSVFYACGLAPQHNYLFLTKNPQRYAELYDKGLLPTRNNMWFGSTVTKNSIPFFSDKALKNFISIEPILDDFGKMDGECQYLDWAIIGAETGKRKGKVVPKAEWIMSIAEDCAKAGIPVFMKDSLVPIVGEQNMRRELPPELRR